MLFNLLFFQHFKLVVPTAHALVLSEVVYIVEYDCLMFALRSCTWNDIGMMSRFGLFWVHRTILMLKILLQEAVHCCLISGILCWLSIIHGQMFAKVRGCVGLSKHLTVKYLTREGEHFLGIGSYHHCCQYPKICMPNPTVRILKKMIRI